MGSEIKDIIARVLLHSRNRTASVQTKLVLKALHDEPEKLTAFIAEAGMGWRPIETAPKDDTEVDLWWRTDWDEEFRVPECKYRDEHSWIDSSGNIIDGQYVTHWSSPLPPPPEEKPDGERAGE